MASMDNSEFISVRLASAPGSNFPSSGSSVDGSVQERADSTDILISVVPPETGVRPPTDVCCVVDVSGSMGALCTNCDAESPGLSVLDIVKHACKTIVHSLSAQDRFSLVSYSTTATVALEQVYMTQEGLASAEAAIDALYPAGQTNIWEGLHNGLKVLNSGEMDRMKSVLLLTDGMPNVVPPRGHLAMLKQYKEETGMECTISTFGFGYALDSELLKDLAREGQGIYAFVPDGSFVGTAFVNATSNILATAARNTVVKLSGLSDAAVKAATVPGYSSLVKSSWGLHVEIGPVMFGQSRDVIVSVPQHLLAGDGAAAKVRADVDYLESGSSSRKTCTCEGLTAQADPAAAFHSLRAHTLATLTELHAAFSRAKGVSTQRAMQELCQAMVAHVKSHTTGTSLSASASSSLAASDPACSVALEAFLEDLEGQVTEATSRDDWWNKWGKHYLTSLIAAHTLQLCHNFKDPGVQNYGGPLFRSLRDAAEKTFLQLPPPVGSFARARGHTTRTHTMAFPAPSQHSSAVQTATLATSSAASAHIPIATAQPVIDMSSFYNAQGGCFVGGALVSMAAPSPTPLPSSAAAPPLTSSFVSPLCKQASELRKGDRIQSFRRNPSDGSLEMGVGEVAMVCETLLSEPPLLVTLPSGLQLTAWHPVIDSKATSNAKQNGSYGSNPWAFPAQLAASAGVQVDNDDNDGLSNELSAGHLSHVKSLFNVALLPDAATGQPWHGCFLNGVPTILLGHGIEGDEVASHAYYGTNAVLDDLARFDAEGSGHVRITSDEAAAAVAAAMGMQQHTIEEPKSEPTVHFMDGTELAEPKTEPAIAPAEGPTLGRRHRLRVRLPSPFRPILRFGTPRPAQYLGDYDDQLQTTAGLTSIDIEIEAEAKSHAS